MKDKLFSKERFEQAMDEIPRKALLFDFIKYMGMALGGLAVLLVVLTISMTFHNLMGVALLWGATGIILVKTCLWLVVFIWIYLILKASIEKRFSVGKKICDSLLKMGYIMASVYAVVVVIASLFAPTVAFVFAWFSAICTFYLLLFMEVIRVLVPFVVACLREKNETK